MDKLFDPEISGSDKNYLALRDNPKFTDLREYCEFLWSRFCLYADKSFRFEFANHLHSRFWEMYLANELLDNGLGLIPRNTIMGPDIQLKIGRTSVWIEAIAPEEGEGDDSVPNIFNHFRYDPIPEDQIILRFTNAITEKYKRYEEYVESGIVNLEDIFVIALNSGVIGMLSYYSDPLPAIVKSVYPIDKFTIEFDSETSGIRRSYFQYRLEIIKESGSSVPTSFFLDKDYTGISGILYSETTLWNLPSKSENDFLFVHNSNAHNPIDKGWIEFKKGYSFEENRLNIY